MKKIAIISVILDNPEETKKEFNEIIFEYKDIIKGRFGVPIEVGGVLVTALAITATSDDITSLSKKISKLKNSIVKTAISKGKKIKNKK